MGRDKGTVAYHGRAQAAFLQKLLTRVCGSAVVSIHRTQQGQAPYDRLPVIVDAVPQQGPVTGLFAAHQRQPDWAWLAVAVDLAMLDVATIEVLLTGRRPDLAATAFEHPDGTLEPLCTIWEPSGLDRLVVRLKQGDCSPRRCLESLDIQRLRCTNPRAIQSVDSPAERDRVLTELRDGNTTR